MSTTTSPPAHSPAHRAASPQPAEDAEESTPELVGQADKLLALQRVAGNRAVQRLLGGRAPEILAVSRVPNLSVLQREPPTPTNIAANQGTPEIQEAITGGTLAGVSKIKDFSGATDQQKVRLIQIVLKEQRSSQEAAWTTLQRLWSGFGPRLPQVVEGVAAAEWEQSMDSAYVLMKGVPEVRNRTDDFTKDIRQFASKNLFDNREYVQKELAKVGSASEAKDVPTAEQQKEIRRGMQSLAYQAWVLKANQNKMKQLEVGWSGSGLGAKAVKFDPNTPPAYIGLLSKPQARWEDLKKEWNDAQGKLTELAGKYPELYEALAQDDAGDALLNYSRLLPDAFYSRSSELLKSLALRIDKAQKIIDDQEINYLDLTEVHKALYGGMYASKGRNWTGGFDQRVAKRLVGKHATDKKETAALLNMATFTALVLASFATGGMALALTGVAVAIPAAQAAAASNQASKLETVSKATPLSGTGLVTQIQVDMASAEATAKMVEAVMNAILLGAPLAADAIQTIRLKALVSDAGLLAKLQSKVKDPAQLEKLLKKVKDPQELDTLLTHTPDPAKLEELLLARQQFRERFAQRWEEDRAAIEKFKAENPDLRHIPTEDLVAVRGYCGNDSALLNRALRGQTTPAEAALLEPYIKTATSGLEHLPRFQGTVTRAEVNTADQYAAGKVFTQDGFMSTSMGGGKFSGKATVHLEIESVNGRIVEHISPHGFEKEVLFKPGTRFQVVSKTQPYGPAFTKVKLKELP